MADFAINISVDQIKPIVEQIIQSNRDVKARMDDVTREMDKLSTTTWESDSADQIRDKFMNQKKKFAVYESVIIEYVNFLNRTIDAYTAAENNIKNQVASEIAFK